MLVADPAVGAPIAGLPTATVRAQVSQDRGLPGSNASRQAIDRIVYNGRNPSRRATGFLADPATNDDTATLSDSELAAMPLVVASGVAQDGAVGVTSRVAGPLGTAAGPDSTPFALSESKATLTRYWFLESDLGAAEIPVESAEAFLQGNLRRLVEGGAETLAETRVTFEARQIDSAGAVVRELISIEVGIGASAAVSVRSNGIVDPAWLAASVNQRDPSIAETPTWDVTYYEAFDAARADWNLPVGEVFGVQVSTTLRSSVAGFGVERALVDGHFLFGGGFDFELTEQQSQTARLTEVLSVPEPHGIALVVALGCVNPCGRRQVSRHADGTRR